jgi:hypothetical protein
MSPEVTTKLWLSTSCSRRRITNDQLAQSNHSCNLGFLATFDVDHRDIAHLILRLRLRSLDRLGQGFGTLYEVLGRFAITVGNRVSDQVSGKAVDFQRSGTSGILRPDEQRT